MTKKNTDLSRKQLIFVKEYGVDRNATRAAIAAGYAKASAAVAGSRMLRNAKVREKIDEATSSLCQELEITAQTVLRGLAQLAFYDPRQLFNADGSVKQITELNEICAMSLRGIDVQTTEETKIEEVDPAEQKAAAGEKKAAGKKDNTQGELVPAAPKLVRRRTITSKIRLADRGENLERLGRHLKLFTDQLELQDTTPYDPERDGDRIIHLLAKAVGSISHAARP